MWRGRESLLTVATARISSFTTARSFAVATVRSFTRARRRVRHLDYQPVSLIGLHRHDIVATTARHHSSTTPSKVKGTRYRAENSPDISRSVGERNLSPYKAADCTVSANNTGALQGVCVDGRIESFFLNSSVGARLLATLRSEVTRFV